MKTKASLFPQNYLAALSKYLQKRPASSLQPARKLGLLAVSSGLETLELAKIHEQALIELLLPDYSLRRSDTMIRRAGLFFAEAVTPIEDTHPGAQKAGIRLKVVIQSLSQRSVELATSNKKLENEIAQRKVLEDSLRTSEMTSSQLLEKSLSMQEELRHLSRRLLSAQEEERKRVSRELHDVIAQTLTGINVRLTALKTLSTTSAKDLHKKIAITQRLVEKSVGIVHRFARDLRPSVLDDLGLTPALHAYLKGFMEQTGIRAAFTTYAGVEKLDNASRTVLYRVAQEALSNVARHARATHANVHIHGHNGSVCMEIHDNGRGFQVEGAGFANSNKRLGLLGMRERVEMVGGTFCVESDPGKKTTVRVEIPQGGNGATKPPKKKSAKNATLKCP